MINVFNFAAYGDIGVGFACLVALERCSGYAYQLCRFSLRQIGVHTRRREGNSFFHIAHLLLMIAAVVSAVFAILTFFS